MAYVEKYLIPWSSPTNKGYVYIDKLNSVDPSQYLILSNDGIKINTTFEDWNEPILGQTAQITIQSDASGISRFQELLPLMSAEEREYRVRIKQTDPSVRYLFEGYLNSDIAEQTYLTKQPINLVASNYIKKLDSVSPASVNMVQKKSLLDLITESLKLTGTDASLRVNMTLCPSGNTIGTTQTALNISACDTEVFWQNSADRDSGLEIITKILKPFDSYMYWWNGDWYIERYDDLDSYPQHYVSYRTDASYGWTNTATSINRTDVSLNINSFKPLERSQMLTMIPGLNKLEINCEDEYYDNLLYPDLKGMTPISYGFIVQNRTWRYTNDPSYNFSDAMLKFGNPYGYINNACMMYFDQAFIGKDANTYPYNQYKYHDCLMAGFRITIDSSSAENPTTLNLKWKWKPLLGDYNNPYYKSYTIRWYLKFSNTYYHIHQDVSGNWIKKYSTNNDLGHNAYLISPADLDKNKDYVYEANISIPIGSIPDIPTGDQDLTFCILPPSYRFESDVPGATGDWYVISNVWGDATAEVTTTPQPNRIYPEINNRFLNKKSIDLDLFDIKSLNYKNGIYVGPGYAWRSSLWFDDTSTYYSLIDRLIKNKFKLYNKTRQSISATIDCSTYLKPLSMWYDSYQPSKSFTLVGYTYYPTLNRYDCVWNEYDNNTIVNLNNAN